MSARKPQNSAIRAIKKFFLSAFVTFSFIAYALENRGTAPQTTIPVTAGTEPSTNSQPVTNDDAPAVVQANPPAASAASPATAPAATPTTAQANPNPSAASSAASGLKDGTYTGSQVFVNWGYVQVQATIQNGQLTNVQFLQYPSDRRTSQRINSSANPVLQQEAVQAQSANVDIVTGATLTSRGFRQSLQTALNQAKG